MSLFTEYEFSKCINRYKGDWHAIKFNCRDQFLVISFVNSLTETACEILIQLFAFAIRICTGPG